ncbi:MAG: magnesium chelatase [Actinomycetota bacterium]|nr:magnesium chelatase [Actinomycetota bacterium]
MTRFIRRKGTVAGMSSVAFRDAARPATLGQLRQSGWEPAPIKEEVRRNVAARIAAGQPVVDGVVGYDDTVLPQLENALLAGHDVIFLGERGQAKTRIIRSLVDLLDEWIPVVAGSEINDDPYHPVSRHARDLVRDHGEGTPIEWAHRSTRFGEKLATPDTSIADLIGEVDPIKVAEGRYLSDELTLHYGLVPRSNRGIFAINELPDLAERIQVGLLNVLEERDIQVRGYKIRLPLDLMLVASANPEDYTNRGRIITPLKDRFGAQIRTHYPLDTDLELAVVRQEARPVDAAAVGVRGLRVEVPDHMADIVATLSHEARRSPHVNQRSGVSVRLTIANYETMVANATRRALRAGETVVVPRVSDLEAIPASTAGKVEIETLDEGDDGAVLERLVKSAVLGVFRQRCPIERFRDVLAEFDEGTIVHTGDDVPSAEYVRALARLPALRAAVLPLAGTEHPAALASALELILEGLHLSRRLNKDAAGARATYRGRG